VIINDLNIKCIAIFKAETYAPLVINADTPLTGTVMGQCFKSVGRRYAQIVETDGPVQLGQTHSCTLQYILRNAA